jgi:serine/threonine protein kinase
MGVKSITPLPPGTCIDDYAIKRVLGGGGFSIVYLAVDSKNGEEVVIKEYFPAKMASRGEDLHVHAKDAESAEMYRLGRKLFFQEASILASIDHPNIVKVLSFSQSNSTTYLVLEYEKGISLQSYVRRYGAPVPEAKVKFIFTALLDALSAVHEQGLLHLDIKPGNIYLRDTKGPLLLDFGAVHKILRSAPARLFPVITHGFSPPEQSMKNSNLGPATDLYAVGASMRACIEGKPPLSAKERRKGKEFIAASKLYAGQYSELTLHIMDWCMEMSPSDRPKSAKDVLKLLKLEMSATPVSIPA